MGEHRTIGWKLDVDDRSVLLRIVSPNWPDVIADHVTLRSHVAPTDNLPPPTRGDVVGEIDDGEGVQALVVRIDGTTDRPDGSTYHMTWSLDRARGRRARDSNEVIARLGWRRWDQPMAVRLIPADL